MIQKLKTVILSSVLLFSFAAPAMAASPIAAVDLQGNVCSGASSLEVGTDTTNNNAPSASQKANCKTDTNATSSVNNIITLILNILSVVIGIAAVIMIILAGFRYITSGGKEDTVKKAKDGILYAVIGLIVVALAQVIVKFVLNKATNV